MKPILDQGQRIAKLHSPYASSDVGVHRFTGREALSAPFTYQVEIYSTLDAIDFDQALGSNVSVEVMRYDGSTRAFDGILTAAQWLGKRDAYYFYRMELRPWFWLLTKTTDCRLFHEKTVVEIIEEVFGDHGFAKFRKALNESYPTIEYCVQYRETDFAFVSRLMEKYGIYYMFEHSIGTHEMVLCDSKASHKPLPGAAQLPYIALTGQDRTDKEHVSEWVHNRTFNTGKVVYNDYDFEKPQSDLLAPTEADAAYAESKLEHYDYPGKYVEQSKGEKFAKVKLQAEQADDHTRSAAGDAVGIFPGGLFTLTGHPSGGNNIEYLVTGATHDLTVEIFRSGAEGEYGNPYRGAYDVLPASIPYRAQLATPLPKIAGAQTAEVVGEGEIDVDEYGRILVKFHWDRDEQDSCRIRVGQLWSGRSWGGAYWPRVGQEVIVQFLEGDPDQPICVGTVYNGDNNVPYELPANKTIGGIKSNSTIGGDGYNEFYFEDEKGQEEICLHAERDYNLVIERDQTYHIKRDRKEQIDRDWINKTNHDIKFEADNLIEFKVFQSIIRLTPQGITIDAPTIKVTGTMSVSVEAPMTDVKGTATLILKGGVVLIN